MDKPKKLHEYLDYQMKKHPQKKSMGQKVNGQWSFYSTEQLVENVNKLAAGLIELGVKAGDRIGVAAYNNRPEWVIVDLACQSIGAIDVPLYPTISPREYEYILNDAGITYVFVGKDDLYDKVKKAQPNVPTLKKIYTMDKQDGKPFWEEVFGSGQEEEIAARKAAIDPMELATIIYTSGTTGNPKGVMLSHNNITSVVSATEEIIPVDAGENVLSFLPLCHIFERAAIYVYLYHGAEVYFTGTDNLGGETGDLQTTKPYFFTTVPRLLEKVYEAIYNKGLALEGAKKKLFFWALSLTDDYEYDQSYGMMDRIKRNVADKLIFSKWRDALGGNIKCIVTGAAPCPSKVLKVFSAAGIPIREGYGLTETSPTLTANTLKKGNSMIGTVGPCVDNVEIHIDRSDGDYREGEGEILAHAPNVMMGYYKKPEANAAVFTEMDGKRWFKTGDVGKFVKGPNGKDFLKITDRKKELLKTSGGKYVAPAPIEGKFREDFLIEQIMIVGDKRKFVSAVIVPAPDALKDWCKNNGVSWTNLSEVVKNEKVIAAYQAICDKVNPDFSHIEQVKKFTLLDCSWDAVKEDGSDAELTPTMKLKRRVVREKYAKNIDGMYS